MECLRSFNFSLAQQANYNAATGLKTWTIGTQNFFLLEQLSPTGSIYNVQGFKNINIYQIEINGDLYSSGLPVGVSAIIQDFNFYLEVLGTNSPSVGNIVSAPNPYNMTEPTTIIPIMLSKFLPKISFKSPIQSAKQIAVKGFYCDGIANQSLINAQIGNTINVTVYYKYEGE